MNRNIATRLAAGLGAGTFALAAATVAAPAAHAESALTYWEDGNSRFEMFISNSTPKTGDTITLSNNFQRKWADEYIYSVKYVVPSCLQYVDGSAKWDVGPVQNVENKSGEEAAFVKANASGVTSWKVTGLGAGFGGKQKVTMDFIVGDSCPIDQELSTTLHYGGSLGDGTYKDKGPTFTVSKRTVIDDISDGLGSLGDTGSLGDMGIPGM